MAILGAAPHDPFNRRVVGTWGQLRTGAGAVPYILTNARLSPNGTDDESRLLRDLQPVREALPNLGQEDFGVLLQRPLDDHRVATRLIPYLLRGAAGGVPSFFPSVLVAAIPFDQESGQPRDGYDDAGAVQVVPDDANFPYGARERQTFGEMFRVSRLWDTHADAAHGSSLAMFEWASERIKLVVLDGQHRAMSFLGILRNVTGWPAGNPYSEFYSGIQIPNGLDFDDLRLPVTLVWFPPTPAGPLDPVRVARSMFVTVNNEARRVGDARILMLNDSELVPLFTRQLLEAMRDPQTPPDCRVLETVLYEDGQQGGPARAASRWTTLTDLKNLGEGVARSVFYPDADQYSLPLYRTNWTPSVTSARLTMQNRLRVGNYFAIDNPQHFHPNALANDEFPDEWAQQLRSLFMDSWGAAILWLFARVGPFGAHAQILQEMVAEWPAVAAPELLAKEAAFEGTGLWSVLENHYNSWVVPAMGPRPNTNPMLAWGLLRDRKDIFETARAERYVGEPPSLVQRDWTRSLFETYKTEACQVGLVGAMTLMVLKLGLVGPAIPQFAQSMSRALERSLRAQRPEGRDRRFALARRQGADDPYKTLNLMQHVLQKGNATEFRYMWIQLLCSPEATAQFQLDLSVVDAGRAIDLVEQVACRARVQYLRMLHRHRKTVLERNNHPTPDAQARLDVGNELSSSLNALFDSNFTADSVWVCDAAEPDLPHGAQAEAAAQDQVGDDEADRAEGEVDTEEI